MRTREGLPDRSPIAPSQARLTLELFCDGLPEKKLQLVDMSILINPIKPWAGMSQSKGMGFFDGLVPHLVEYGLSILQYADDTILF
jgi:hypothetical protein